MLEHLTPTNFHGQQGSQADNVVVEAAVGIRQRLIKVGSGVKHPLGQDGFALVRHTEAAVRLQNVRRSLPMNVQRTIKSGVRATSVRH